MPFLTSEVFEGAKGYLFLARGSNDVVGLFSEATDMRAALLQQWADLLEQRNRRLGDLGVTYRQCFVPDKLSIYREEAQELWAGLSSPAEAIEALDCPSLRPLLVPLTGPLRQLKAEHQIFFPNDTHWTVAGCFSAYQLLCASLNVVPRLDLINAALGQIELAGDLGGKLVPPRRGLFEFGSFGRSATRTYANRLVSLRETGQLTNDVSLHVGSIVQFNNPRPNSKHRVLLFGDSFSEYRTHYLTGLLADTFSDLMFVWSSNIDYAIVASFRPDIVLVEMAERFMARLPTDDSDVIGQAEQKANRALAAAAIRGVT